MNRCADRTWLRNATRTLGAAIRRERRDHPLALGMSRELADMTASLAAVASGGIVLDREAVDHCAICGTDYRRKNTYRHLSGRRHRGRVVRKLMQGE